MLACCGCVMQPANVVPSGTARVAFQSQCAQLVVTCTSSWPTALIDVQSDADTVTATDTGFLVDTMGQSSATVNLIGSISEPGNGATIHSFTWSFGATDDDPCTLAPGTVLATTADTPATLESGFHYIRLRVENDIIRARIESELCGLIGTDLPSFDFVEVEIEVR